MNKIICVPALAGILIFANIAFGDAEDKCSVDGYKACAGGKPWGTDISSARGADGAAYHMSVQKVFVSALKAIGDSSLATMAANEKAYEELSKVGVSPLLGPPEPVSTGAIEKEKFPQSYFIRYSGDLIGHVVVSGVSTKLDPGYYFIKATEKYGTPKKTKNYKVECGSTECEGEEGYLSKIAVWSSSNDGMITVLAAQPAETRQPTGNVHLLYSIRIHQPSMQKAMKELSEKLKAESKGRRKNEKGKVHEGADSVEF
jgi:hypothetical protein